MWTEPLDEGERKMSKKNFAASFVTQIRGADKIVKEILLCRNLKKKFLLAKWKKKRERFIRRTFKR